ncbi:MAG: metallopeptidase family protein [Solirubrobacteraceae bacterium]
MNDRQPTVRRILFSAIAALTIGLGAASLATGLSGSFPLRLIQAVAVFAAGAIVVGGVVVLALVHLAGWRDPESESEFDALVERAERLAADGAWGGRDHGGDPTDDPYQATDDEEFKALVHAAVDELPLEFHRALEHVAIVVSDGGWERHAYGLYQGDTVARDFFHDRIIIFRDTLVRDFGHDQDLLRAQVTRTVRHELAHHLGWGETGVRGLGL